MASPSACGFSTSRSSTAIAAEMGFLAAGLRGTVGYWISTVIFFLGFIWAAFDKNKEAWHNKIFGTGVVKA